MLNIKLFLFRVNLAEKHRSFAHQSEEYTTERTVVPPVLKSNFHLFSPRVKLMCKTVRVVQFVAKKEKH